MLARSGFDVEQLPRSDKQKSPDFHLEGRPFDNYAPTTNKASSIRQSIDRRKVNPPGGRGSQVRRIVLNLADSQVDISELQAQFRDHPMANLDEALAITREGDIVSLWP